MSTTFFRTAGSARLHGSLYSFSPRTGASEAHCRGSQALIKPDSPSGEPRIGP